MTQDLLGVSSEQKRMMGLGLGDLVAPGAGGGLYGVRVPSEGPVDYVNLAASEDQKIACIQFGLLFVREGDRRLAVLVRGADTRGYGQAGVNVEVMATDRAAAEEFLVGLRKSMRARNVYRGGSSPSR